MTSLPFPCRFLPRTAWLLLALGLVAIPTAALDLGVARIGVTPTEPVRLTGYASRKKPSEGVEHALWVKALAIGSDRESPAVLLTLDNCGIAEETWRKVRSRLAKSARLKGANIVIAISHTHSAPATKNWAPNIFVQDLPPEQLAAIDRYTSNLIEKLEQVALDALKNRQPGKLSWSQGNVGFAKNRRPVRAGGTPALVDQSLPVLKAESADGKLLALVANYACHCTTLGGEFNHVCGDWAGFAQAAIERDHPGALALITIGCGADANPSPRGGTDFGLALAKQHGDELAAEVKRLLGLTFTPLNSKLSAAAKEISLPFGPHFTRDQWLARSTNAGIVGYHAKKWLARLDRGEKLPDALYYPITAWNFGDELALVFLPGEVVVDYALRLKRELDAQRLWVSSYANYVPCYIPSRRILAEGGYEAEDSLWYYDRPARISTNAEDLIIRTVEEMVPKGFHVHPKKAERPAPNTPQQALETFRTHADLAIELVASEPLIASPVAIDWDARGRLWVCEMYDYPSGMNPKDDPTRKFGEPVKEPPGGFAPGGRIKILNDTNGDGHYDEATLFLDHIPFPTGVMPWRKGALICAAPNILYAEDTDGDGRADFVRTNVTGFVTHNFQARVNGFTWGLDGWLHGSSGLFGGKVKSLQTGKEVDLSGRDFRYQPDTGEIEPVAGISQYGRVRDDFDNWFGNDNSTLLWHYPLPDHYLRRNPYVTYPEPRVLVARGGDANKLFPISRTLDRFNHPESANIVTSACGPDIYRDVLLGTNYYGNAFICEPVHNLVHRLVLEPEGVTFAGRRADDEQRSEFLASTDNWFRPVQVRTGPDGALYVVDMYRFVIEHPRWIPPERREGLDMRAGADMGRIYRVVPKEGKLRPIRNLTKLDTAQLATVINTPNGTTRDLADRALRQQRPEGEAIPTEALSSVATNGVSAGARAQSARILAALGAFTRPVAQSLYDDPDRRLACQELKCAEELYLAGPAQHQASDTYGAVMTESSMRHILVQFQSALTLGLAGTNLFALAFPWHAVEQHPDDPWIRAAALASATNYPNLLLQATLGNIKTNASPGLMELARQLIATCVAMDKRTELASAWRFAVSNYANAQFMLESKRVQLLGAFLDSLERRGLTSQEFLSGAGTDSRARALPNDLQELTGRAQEQWRNAGQRAHPDELLSFLPLLGRDPSRIENDALLLSASLRRLPEPEGRRAVLQRLRQMKSPEVADAILDQWKDMLPAGRAEAVRLLVERTEWATKLLTAVERGTVAPVEIPLATGDQLLRHSVPAIRLKAGTLLALIPGSSRRTVLTHYQGINSVTADPRRGPELFEKNCAQCHAMRGRGHDVGPNLAEFAGKSMPDFLFAILDPNAGINPNYLGYELQMKDGRTLSGIVRNETASGLTLVQGGGTRETILRSDIASLKASSLSLMPEGLEQALTPQDMADMVAWIKGSAPAQFGSASKEQAANALVEFSRDNGITSPEVMACVERLPYPSWMGRQPLAYCRQSAGQERLVWRAPPSRVTGARALFRFPTAMGFVSQPRGKFTLKVNGGSSLEFDATLTDHTWETPDGRLRMNYTVREANSEDSNGVLEIDAAQELVTGKTTQFEVTGSPSNSQRWFGIYVLAEQAAARR